MLLFVFCLCAGIVVAFRGALLIATAGLLVSVAGVTSGVLAGQDFGQLAWTAVTAILGFNLGVGLGLLARYLIRSRRKSPDREGNPSA